MKAVILAGGLGTRLGNLTETIPKPMVKIDNKPILYHIMSTFSKYGINDFIIALGYKSEVIKDYFLNYQAYNSDFTIDLTKNNLNIHDNKTEPWKITLVNTGEKTLTGSRIKKIFPYIKNDDYFCLTYGDGLSNLNIKNLIKFHINHNKLATITAAIPPSRFGALRIKDKKVLNFNEKPFGRDGYINGGFFVLSPNIINYIKDDEFCSWEQEPLTNLANDGELMSYVHDDFWHPMDTLRDKQYLDMLWKKNDAPWKIW